MGVIISLAIVGLLCGGLFNELPALLGLAVGLLAGWTVDLKRRVRRLEREIQARSPSTPETDERPGGIRAAGPFSAARDGFKAGSAPTGSGTSRDTAAATSRPG